MRSRKAYKKMNQGGLNAVCSSHYHLDSVKGSSPDVNPNEEPPVIQIQRPNGNYAQQDNVLEVVTLQQDLLPQCINYD